MGSLNKVALKAGFWFTICNVVQRGIQFLYTPIYSRLLSTDGYGRYSTFLAWESILAVFATLNLSNAVFNKGMVKYENDNHRFVHSMYGLSFVSTIVTGLIFAVIRFFLSSSIRLSTGECVLLFVVMYFKMAIQLWSSEERYNFKYMALLVVTIMSSLLNPLLSILLFYFKHDYKCMEWGYAASMFSVGIVLICASKKSKWFFYVKEYWKYALLFVLPLIPHYLSNVILYQSDRLMIGFFCDDGSVGIYTLAYQLSLATTVVFTAINNALVPWLYRKIKYTDYISITNVVMVTVTIVLIISFGIILVAPELIYILGSAKFESAVPIVAPIVVSTLIMFVNTLILDVLFYYEKNKVIMIATVSGAIINLVLNYLLIPKMGYEIAAYTTVIGYTVILMINFSDLTSINLPFRYINNKTILIIVFGIATCFLLQGAFALPTVLRWILTIILCLGGLFIFYRYCFFSFKTKMGEDQI